MLLSLYNLQNYRPLEVIGGSLTEQTHHEIESVFRRLNLGQPWPYYIKHLVTQLLMLPYLRDL